MRFYGGFAIRPTGDPDFVDVTYPGVSLYRAMNSAGSPGCMGETTVFLSTMTPYLFAKDIFDRFCPAVDVNGLTLAGTQDA